MRKIVSNLRMELDNAWNDDRMATNLYWELSEVVTNLEAEVSKPVTENERFATLENKEGNKMYIKVSAIDFIEVEGDFVKIYMRGNYMIELNFETNEEILENLIADLKG